MFLIISDFEINFTLNHFTAISNNWNAHYAYLLLKLNVIENDTYCMILIEILIKQRVELYFGMSYNFLCTMLQQNIAFYNR